MDAYLTGLSAAYVPADLSILALVFAFPALSLLLGPLALRLPGRLGRLVCWSWVIAAVVVVERATAEDPPGFRMLAICLVLLLGMKPVVAREDREGGGPALSFLAWLGWAGMWPGMRPGSFAKRGAPDLAEGRRLAIKGLVRVLAGALLMGAAWGTWRGTGSRILATIPLLPGISLILHFGLFNLLAGFWRGLGMRCRTLFPHPLASKTLSEFWGRRWNLPFTEMIQRAIYRPLSGPIGRNGAALAGFIASGLLHELAISVPVQGGYGLPLAYFAVHGGLILIERRPGVKAWLESGARGRVWTIAWLALPAPVLFHPAFLEGIIWPLVGIPPLA